MSFSSSILIRFSSVFAGLFFNLATIAWAIPPGGDRVGFSNLTPESGLSSGVVSEVIQDSKGIVWAATDYGLNRFDGFETQVFHHGPESEDSLSGNHLTALCEDADGMLWVGTAGAGLNRFNPATGRCQRLTTRPGERGGLQSDVIHCLAHDPRGFVWVGTGAGLHRIEVASMFVRVMPAELGKEPVSAVRLDPRGQVWAATAAGGVYRLDQSADFHQLVLKTKTAVLDMAFDGKGALWLATQGEGLIKTDASRGTIEKTYQPEKDGAKRDTSLPGLEVETLHIDSQGRLWAGTSRGLARFDAAGEQFQTFRRNGLDPLSIAGDSILSLFESPGGTLWVGAEGGGVSWTQLGDYWFPAVQAGLSHPSVWGMIQGRDGLLRIGTDSGLNEWNPKTGEFTQPLAGLDNLPSTCIHALLEDSKGRLWMGTRGGGVMRMEPGGERIVLFRHDPAKPDSLVHDTVSEIFEDNVGRIWIGTLGSGPMQFLDREDGDSSLRPLQVAGEAAETTSRARHVTSYCQDPAGRLWMGAGDGLYRLNPETGVLTHYSHFKIGGERLSTDSVTVIHPDAQGNLWVGTAGGGLNQYHPGTGRVVVIDRENSRLPDNQIFGILAGEEGCLWVSTARGLARVDSSSREVRSFHRGNGLQGEVFHAKAFARGDDGRLYFGGPNGFNIIEPARLPKEETAPVPVLTGLEIRGEKVEPSPDGDGILKQPVSSGGSFELPFAKNNRVTFRFSVRDVATAGGAWFRYRLEGLEDEWRVTRSERRADYAGLPAGRYTFQVQASRNGTDWTAESAGIAMAALPPWHRTPRAYALFGLGAVALLAGLAAALSCARASRQRRVHLDLEARQNGAEMRLNRQRHHTLLLEKTNREIGTSVLRSRPFDTVLRQLRDHFGSCRGLILTLDRNREVDGEPALTLVAQNCGEEVPVLKGDPVPHGGRSFLDRALQTTDSISSSMPGYDAATHPPLRNLLLGWGIKSFVAVPLLHHGRPNGLLILHQITDERSWATDEVDLLESIGCLLGFAFAQMEAAEHFAALPAQKAEPSPEIIEAAVKQGAARADREKKTLLGTIARELQVPVSAILGFSSALKRDPDLEESSRDLVEIVEHGGRHLNAVVGSLLDLSRIDDGSVPLKETRFETSRLLQAVERMIALKARMTRTDWHMDQPAALPRLIQGDPDKLRQVLITLAAFAVSRSSGGEVALDIRARALSQPVAEGDIRRRKIGLTFEIRDSGPALDESAIAALFPPISEADEENGYGLSVARALIHRMGGRFAVNPAETGGLVYRIGIPCEEIVPGKAAETGEVTGKMP